MAGVDGLEATRRIRALEGQRGQVPIIALTANALDQHVEACRQGGMSEHLAKPFTRTELLTAITRAAAQRPRPPSGAATTLEAMLSD
jgi:CheY-like chemotaxis protein